VKLPASIERITPDWGAAGRSTYPPPGFVPFAENALGNGDQFGLYWPFGGEKREPLVAEMQHDGWAIAPAFSSLDAFLAAAGEDDGWVEAPTVEADPDSPVACLAAAGDLAQRGQVEGVIELLRRAVARLPEFGTAQWMLSRMLARAKRQHEAFAPAIAAALAPPCFGGASREALDWLRRQSDCPQEIGADPLWRRRSELRFVFGGAKENGDYAVLREIVAQYRELGMHVQAMLLLQTYGELLSRETVSFQQRVGFSQAEHIAAQLRLGRELGIDRRAEDGA